MNKEQSAAFLISQSVAAMIEAMGMHAENQFDQTVNRNPSYTTMDFRKIIEERGLGHNDLVTRILQSE